MFGFQVDVWHLIGFSPASSPAALCGIQVDEHKKISAIGAVDSTAYLMLHFWIEM